MQKDGVRASARGPHLVRIRFNQTSNIGNGVAGGHANQGMHVIAGPISTVFQRGTHPIAALPNRHLGKADRVEVIFVGFYAGDLHLNLNDAGINASCAQILLSMKGCALSRTVLRGTMTNELRTLTAHLVLTIHVFLANRR